MSESEEIKDFLLDNYGYCTMGAACNCLRFGWRGRGCQCWKPHGPTTYEELEAEDRKMYDYYDKQRGVM